MGVMQHRILTATFWEEETFDQAWYWVQFNVPENLKGLFLKGYGICNNENTIVMIPDGSKEGWAHSQEADEVRDKAAAYFESLHCGYVCVMSYGEKGERVEFPDRQKDSISMSKGRYVELVVAEEQYRRSQLKYDSNDERIESFEARVRKELEL